LSLSPENKNSSFPHIKYLFLRMIPNKNAHVIILIKRPKYSLERDEKTIYGLGLWPFFPLIFPQPTKN
jgi:hypothetical protein